jgi:hypothetical protein
MIGELNRYITGWMNYFRLARMQKKMMRISGWMKRRLRCFRLKQCKRAKGIARFLGGLGVPQSRRWLSAVSRKGWWRKALSPPATEGMDNKWFGQQGLIDLKTIYTVLHSKKPPYTRVRTVV